MLGKDAIVLKDGKQVTEFKEGILPWSIQNPVAIVFDEYDAGRPDVMFVIQRILEVDGKLTLLDQNQVISPHSSLSEVKLLDSDLTKLIFHRPLEFFELQT